MYKFVLKTIINDENNNPFYIGKQLENSALPYLKRKFKGIEIWGLNVQAIFPAAIGDISNLSKLNEFDEKNFK